MEDTIGPESLLKLQQILDTRNFLVQDPYLYRGRDYDGLVKIKDTNQYDAPRKTRDTPQEIDYLVQDFITSCFTDYPDRRFSRFATTYRGDAQIYGDHIYVIFPHKDAKISHSETEAYEFFNEHYQNQISRFVHLFFRVEIDGFTLMRDFNREELINTSFYVLSKRLKELFLDRKNVDIASYVGCDESNIIEMIDSQRSKLLNSEDIITYKKELAMEAIDHLKDLFQGVIFNYFDSVKIGYPATKLDGGGEVMYQGKYLQVSQKLMEEYNS